LFEGTLSGQVHQINASTTLVDPYRRQSLPMTQVHKIFLSVLVLLASSTVCMTQTHKYPFQRGDGDLLSELSWSPRNDLILTSSGDANGLSLWEVNSGKLLWKTDIGFLQDELELYSIRHSAWTTDQRLILFSRSGELEIGTQGLESCRWRVAPRLEP